MDGAVKGKILIVDDEALNLKAFTQILQSEYIVYTAKNGENAIEIAIEQRPDVILLDILMPGADGFEAMKRLIFSVSYTTIPAIFLTASNDSKIRAKCAEMGAVDFIAKPFSATVLLDCVKHHLRGGKTDS
jgi:putative two-component system response regulator